MLRSSLATALALSAAPAFAQPADVNSSPWQTSLVGGGVHQFETDLEDDGAYSVTRAYFEAGIAYAFDRRTSLGVSLGYGFDGYDFSGTSGLAGLDPWENIHEFRLSAPFRVGISERVDVFAIPSVRSTAESGADRGEAINGGALAGFTYRVNDRLTIGPGVGAFTEIEDDASIFPILLIDWRITDTLSLRTGGATGATRGPGLTLSWTGLERWTFTVGARYETWRFRLDDEGVAPDGVGEEQGVPVFLSASYDVVPNVSLTLLAGADVANELTLEDASGNTITDEDADAAPFLGLGFRARF